MGGGGGAKDMLAPVYFFSMVANGHDPNAPPPRLDRHRIHPEGPQRVPEGPDASRRALICPADPSYSHRPWSVPSAMSRLVRSQFVPRGPAPSPRGPDS